LGWQDSSGYYRLFGLTPDASADELARAFRRLAKEWHPDRNPAPNAAARFQQLSEAYAVLLAARSSAAAYGEAAAPPKARPASGLWPVAIGLVGPVVAAMVFVHGHLAGGAARPGRPDAPPAAPPPNAAAAASDDSPILQAPAPIAVCAHVPDDGAVVEGAVARGPFGHHLDVTNGSDGASIIKLRDAHTGRALLAFFVGKGGHARVGPLPDGDYHIQYAIGADLAPDCRAFTAIDRAAEFPDPDRLKTEYRDGGVVTQTLSYVLYAAPGGNVRAQTIDPQKFLEE
jgi:hypothetical protein